MVSDLIFLLLPVLLLLPCKVAAQDFNTFPRDTLKEAGRVFSSPFHITKSGAELAAAVVAADLLAYSLDT